MKTKYVEIHMNEFNHAYTCGCGNTATDYGFYPCNAYGEYMEPLLHVWKHHYKCDKCDTIYKVLTK